LDDYKIEELIGNGSTGFVHSVACKKTARKFAARIFKTRNLADQRGVEYLMNEIKVMRKLDYRG
jgi:serine/threonine protein kinase